MAYLERRVQKGIKDHKAYEEWEQKWETIEQRLGGFPAKRHYGLISGREDFGTVVWERDWPTMAAMEAAYDKSNVDSEANSLGSTASSLYNSERIEYYWTF